LTQEGTKHEFDRAIQIGPTNQPDLSCTVF
jgi:hypothetical protein